MKNITIIGAGLGGLTAGALLAKQGHKVTLLEQHNIVGGCATTFKRKGGYTCEVGLHEMDAAFGTDKKELLESLGVYEHIEFVQPSEFFHIVADTMDFTMPHDKPEALKLLTMTFPHEEESIKKYFSLLESISAEIEALTTASWWQYALFPFLFRHLLRFRATTTTAMMDTLFEDENLKLILNGNVAYYSDKVSSLSFLLHAIAQHSYFTGGGWYIKGGSQKLSDHLASVITQHGGTIITRADVTQIDTSMVTYTHKKESVGIESDIIISNLAPSATYALANIAYEEKLRPASSILTIYMGFKHNLKSIYGKKPYTSFLHGGIKSIQEYDEMMDGDIESRSLVFTDYSQIDSGLTKDTDKSFGVLLCTDFLKDWEALSSEAYSEKKEALMAHFLDKLELTYPNIRDHIEFAEMATAKTIQRYIKTPNGTAYGFAPTPKQFFRAPQVQSKKMKNLYFVGQWVIGGGFSPAIISGGLCAEKISKKYSR